MNRREYTKEFKQEAVELSFRQGGAKAAESPLLLHIIKNSQMFPSRKRRCAVSMHRLRLHRF